jgi:tetratricopeptide (TPR) repeat protein
VDAPRGREARLDRLFLALCCAALALTVSLSLRSGVNEDDSYQTDYSVRLVSYYRTWGADTAALHVPKGNLHYYGAFFEILTGFANHALGHTPSDARYHDVRHVFTAVLGVTAMVFAALFAGEIAGRLARILTLLFLILSPGFLGHSLMNPKDIPFAAGYVLALYFTLRLIREKPRPRIRTSAGLVLGIAMALGTRVVGVMVPAYIVLFVALDLAVARRGNAGQPRLPVRYLLRVAGIVAAGCLLALAFWPFALQAPLRHTLEAWRGLTNLPVSIRVLFDGANVFADQLSWDALPQWMWRTVPLFTLVGFVGFFLLGTRLRRYPALPVVMAAFSTVLPVLYAMARGSAVYDGWRHFLFVYPTMVVLAALFWSALADGAASAAGKLLVYAAIGGLALEPAAFIASNSRFPYVYYNRTAGGTSGAFGHYETDYWGLSVRPALEWMEAQRLIGPDMREPMTIATTFSYAVRTYVEQRYRGKVRVVYVRYYERYDRRWDYGIFPSRFVWGSHLRNGTWPNSRSVHAVRAAGAPLLSIEKGGGPVFDGKQALSDGDVPAAIAAFREETAVHPDNELGWFELSAALASAGRYGEALEAADRMLGVAPDHPSGLVLKGRLALAAGDDGQAEHYLRRALLEQENAGAHYYLAVVQLRRGDATGALAYLRRAVEAAPDFTEAYELAARIHERTGEAAQAARMRSEAERAAGAAAGRGEAGRP